MDKNLGKGRINECVRRLECLRNEHNFTMKKLCNLKRNSEQENEENRHKIEIIKKSLEKVDQALLDAKVDCDEYESILNFQSCLEAYEIKQNQVELELRVLQSENSWQRNEIQNLISIIQEKDKSITELESQLENLSFMEKIHSLSTDGSSHLQENTVSNSLYLTNNSHLNNSATHIDSEGIESDQISNNFIAKQIPSKVKCLHPIVTQYITQGKYDIALPLCKRVIEDIEATKGHNDPDIAVMLYIMALVYRDQKNYAEAIKYLNDSLHIRESIFGQDDLTVASTLNNLSVLYGKIKQLDEAERMCLQAFKIRENILGPMHADVAKQLTNLALLYQNNNKFIEAEESFSRAKSIFEYQLGPKDPYVIKTECNLGILYVKQEKYLEAMSVFEKILVQLNDNYNEHEGKDVKNMKITYNMPYDQLGHWHKASRVDKPTINTIFKHLNVVYLKLKQNEKLIALRAIKNANSADDKVESVQNLIRMIKVGEPKD